MKGRCERACVHAEVPHASDQPIEPRVWDFWRECPNGEMPAVSGTAAVSARRVQRVRVWIACGCVGQSMEALGH